MDKIKFAIPKGSLEKATAEFFAKSGFKIGSSDRTYRPSINDPQIEMKILRPQEIPVFVIEGLQDLGITGEDWVTENRADVEILQNLEYGKIRLVIAVPKRSRRNHPWRIHGVHLGSWQKLPSKHRIPQHRLRIPQKHT